MRLRDITLVAGLVALQGFADAARIPLVRRSVPNLAARKANMHGVSTLDNVNDLRYQMNITLGGASYEVLVDTGSSDLWVSGDEVPNTKSTGKYTRTRYAKGAAEGPILLAELGFSGYTVEEQAFYFATANDTNQLPAKGLLGLGPFKTSAIAKTLKNESINWLPPLDNIFKSNPKVPNYLTVLLGRSRDPDDPEEGQLTIMEVLEGYENILDQPKMAATEAEYGDQHWEVLLDEDGIIGPDGNAISVESKVNKTENKKQLTAMFDTGFTYPQVPPDVAEGFYGSIKGAKLENITGREKWTLPCDREVNITFKMGGNSYPIHPLDATRPFSEIGVKDRNDCVGTFQPTSPGANSRDRDMILGMAALRNFYLLIDYGSDEGQLSGTDNKHPPYIQLLSTSSDAEELHSDFVKARLSSKGIDTSVKEPAAPDGEDPNQEIQDTGDDEEDKDIKGHLSGDSSSSPNSSDDTATEIKQKAKNIGHNIKKAIIIGAVVAGAVLLFLIGLCCFCCKSQRRRRGGSKRRKSSRRLLSMPWGTAKSYQTLGAPAPAAAVDMQASMEPYDHDSHEKHPTSEYKDTPHY